MSFNSPSHNNDDSLYERLNSKQIGELLSSSSVLTEAIWMIHQQRGVTLVMNNNAHHGYSHRSGIIEVGKENIPLQLKKSFGFSADFPELELKKYIFSHENCHHMLFYMDQHQEKFPHFIEILNLLKTIRQKTGSGVSHLGSLEIYNMHERETAHEEDFVELLNKFCISPKRCKQHLQFLVDTTNNEILHRSRLQKIPQNLADWLFDKIKVSVIQYCALHGITIHI